MNLDATDAKSQDKTRLKIDEKEREPNLGVENEGTKTLPAVDGRDAGATRNSRFAAGARRHRMRSIRFTFSFSHIRRAAAYRCAAHLFTPIGGRAVVDVLRRCS
jgi:hypothetical protein